MGRKQHVNLGAITAYSRHVSSMICNKPDLSLFPSGCPWGITYASGTWCALLAASEVSHAGGKEVNSRIEPQHQKFYYMEGH